MKRNDLSGVLNKFMIYHKLNFPQVAQLTNLSINTIRNTVRCIYPNLQDKAYDSITYLLKMDESTLERLFKKMKLNGSVSSRKKLTIETNETNVENIGSTVTRNIDICFNVEDVLKVLGLSIGDYIRFKDDKALYQIETAPEPAIVKLKNMDYESGDRGWYSLLGKPIEKIIDLKYGDLNVGKVGTPLDFIAESVNCEFTDTYRIAWNKFMDKFPECEFLRKAVEDKLNERVKE